MLVVVTRTTVCLHSTLFKKRCVLVPGWMGFGQFFDSVMYERAEVGDVVCDGILSKKLKLTGGYIGKDRDRLSPFLIGGREMFRVCPLQ